MPSCGERLNRVASALGGRRLERHDRVAALCPNVPALLELHHVSRERKRATLRMRQGF
jgi:acyl-CoA synthetase (AMP-forming)/AMP-acid ligase II